MNEKDLKPDVKPDLRPDFVAIATPLVVKGFRITPVHPQTKCGVMGNWQNFQITTPEEVLAFAKYYPHHNVGVVGKRKPGRYCFLDDDSGVVARIEEETGHKMPRTYTVASRPDTNPLKRHFYFLQTDYSFKRFAIFAEGKDPWKSRNVNRRDLTKFELSRTGLRIHPTMYDAKGFGGGSFVVAAGSVREPDASGRVEIYTVIDDSPVVEIPHWLVDWMIADIKKYRAEKVKEKAAKFARGLHSTVIAEEDVYDYLRWRAGKLTIQGFSGDGLEQALFYLVKKDCERGDVFAASEHGKELIHEIVEAAEEWEVGTALPFYQLGAVKSEILEGHLMIYRTPTKQDVIEQTIASFPDKIGIGEAFERISEDLFKHGFDFDRYKERSAVYRARKAMGFSVEGHLHWTRTETK